MNDAYVDDLKERVRMLSEEQLSALWRWITAEYMNKAARRK